MSCKHTHTHTEFCLQHLSMPLRTHWLDVLWTPDTRVAPGSYHHCPGYFRSPEKETLLCHWHYPHLDDGGQCVDEQLLVGTLGDEESGAAEAQTGSISELQRPRVFGRWGDGGPRQENRVRGKASNAACPASQVKLVAPTTGCQNSVP